MDDSKKVKKNYKLMGTESDPVIIAQRLLNLYRQLHIFSPEKKEAYNKMLMEQTPEVKKTLGSLPGGIVVQQYLADIEAEAGVAVEEFENEASSEDTNYNYSNGNIPHIAMPASISVASDPEMIKGIVETFKEAIQTSEKNRKEDTKELAQTIIALQSKMVQTMISRNKGFSVGEGSVGGGYDGSQLEGIVEAISKAQAELIKELAQTQTKELSSLISNVLKEIQQMSTQSMIDAVQIVHRENMDFFKRQIFTTVSPMSMNNIEPVSLDDFDDSSSQSYKETQETDKKTEEKPEDFMGEQISLDDTDFSATDNTVSETGATDNTVSDTGAEENAEEYEWEYVDEETPTSENAETQSEANGEEYEWEYVDDDGSVAEGEEYAENGEGEYEYEYVEDDGSADFGDYEYAEDTSSDFNGEQAYNDNYIPSESSDNNLGEEEFPDQIELDDSFGLSSNDDL